MPQPEISIRRLADEVLGWAEVPFIYSKRGVISVAIVQRIGLVLVFGGWGVAAFGKIRVLPEEPYPRAATVGGSIMLVGVALLIALRFS